MPVLNLSTEMILPCVYSFFASLGFGLVFNVHGKKLFYAALGGALSWFIYLLFKGWFETDIPQYFLSIVAVSLYSEVMARVHKVPVTVYLIIAFIPLVPGGGAYYTMEYFVNGETERFLEMGLYTLSIAAAIAIGIVLVSSLVRLYSASREKARGRVKKGEKAVE